MSDGFSWRPGRIGVIGAGAMGVSLAAALGQRAPVTIVCRNPARAAFLRRDGAIVRGRAASRPDVVGRIADLAEFGGVSALFVATKTTAIDAVAAELRPLMATVGDQPGAPLAVSFQNGIEPGRQLIEQLGDPRVLRMVLNYGARLAADGVAEITLSRPPHAIGCLDPKYMPACREIAAMLTAGGLEAQAVEDIEPLVWIKGIANAAMNPVAALTDASVGEVLDSPARAIVGRLLDEGIAVATREGIDLGREPGERLWSMLESARPHTPSMVEDIRAGRASEVGQLNRQVIAHALRLGMEARTHELVTALIDAFDWRVFRRAGGDGVGRRMVIGQ
jgi:2-dehydropantoate 2-reductase